MLDDEIEKNYRSITELAEECEVDTHYIRYWEELLEITTKRDSHNHRRYDRRLYSKMKLLINILKKGYYTSQGARDILLPFINKIYDSSALLNKYKLETINKKVLTKLLQNEGNRLL